MGVLPVAITLLLRTCPHPFPYRKFAVRNHVETTGVASLFCRLHLTEVLLSLSVLLTGSTAVMATDFSVSSASEISSAMNDAQPGDNLIMTDGVWNNQDIDFAGDGAPNNPITLRPATQGGVQLTGTSRLSISGSYLVVDGLSFEDGGSDSIDHIIEFRGSDGLANNCRLTNTQIIDYNPSDSNVQYHWVEIFGQDNRVDHCRFEGQDHQGVTLVVRLDDNGQEARHLIDYNAFLDRPASTRNGREAIRVGTSARHTISAKVIVEHNLFENCDGEIEVISHKSEDNIYRFNTLRTCAGTITLRHGGGATVAGNFILGGNKDRSGGIRVIDSDHVIVNNYIANIDDRADAAISLAAGIINGPANGYQPVANVDIHNNTIVDVGGGAVIFDWELNDDFGNNFIKDQVPRNISFVNNLIRSSRTLFEGQEGPGYEWVNNIAFGASLGISSRSGLQQVNPQISIAADGLWRPNSNSPAIDGGTTLPAITIDMDGHSRSGAFDIGADEVSSGTITLRPLTIDDVGPYSQGGDPMEPTNPMDPADLSPPAGTIVDDSFTDGDRSITGDSGNDMEVNFYSTSNNSAIEDDADDDIGTGLIGLVSGTSGRQIHAVFPSQTLANPGDSITACVTFVTPQVVASNLTQSQFNDLSSAVRDGARLSSIPTDGDDLRIGLFSTSTTNGGLDQDISNSSSNSNSALNINGYAVELDVESAASENTTDLEVREYLAANASGRLLGTNGGTSSLTTDGSTGQYVFQPNTQYEVRQTYTLNDSGELDVAVEFLQSGTHLGTLNFTDTSPATLEFGTLALGASSEAFGLSNDPGDPSNGIDISNVTITFGTASEPEPEPEVLKGDVNLNGVVNFQDIPPFISELIEGDYQLEADCDCNDVVNFMDIPVFINILIGN